MEHRIHFTHREQQNTLHAERPTVESSIALLPGTTDRAMIGETVRRGKALDSSGCNSRSETGFSITR